MLQPTGDLAAAALAFFSIAFVVSVVNVVRHGFSRQGGWIFLCLLSILRIVGSSCLIYAQVNNDMSQGLLETAAITSSIGTAPLLLALMGILQRINAGMEEKGLSPVLWRGISIVALVALILAIVGIVDQSNGQVQTGKHLMEGGAAVFLLIYLVLAGLTLLTLARISAVLPTEKTLLRACVVVLPFLLVRVTYTMCVAFAQPGGTFDFHAVDVYATAFMQFLMEVWVVVILACAGLVTPKAARRELKAGARQVDMEAGQYGQHRSQRPQRSQQPQQQQYQRQRGYTQTQGQQQPQSVWDYRPSKLIKNAMASRG